MEPTMPQANGMQLNGDYVIAAIRIDITFISESAGLCCNGSG